MLCFYFWYNRWRPGSFWNLTNEEVKNLDKKKWIIIDGNSLIYRTFYALPPLTNSKGIHTNAVYGFANILLKIIQEERILEIMKKADQVEDILNIERELNRIRTEINQRKNILKNWDQLVDYSSIEVSLREEKFSTSGIQGSPCLLYTSRCV